MNLIIFGYIYNYMKYFLSRITHKVSGGKEKNFMRKTKDNPQLK